jgi:hypothetical protein
MQSLEFSIDLILPIALGIWVDSASKRNEYQGSVLGCKDGRCIELTTLSSSRVDHVETVEAWVPIGLYRDCFINLLLASNLTVPHQLKLSLNIYRLIRGV